MQMVLDLEEELTVSCLKSIHLRWDVITHYPQSVMCFQTASYVLLGISVVQWKPGGGVSV